MSELNHALLSTISFAPFVYERSSPLPRRNWDYAEDILLTVMGQPSPFYGGSVHDIHFYLDDYDLTEYITKRLQKRIREAQTRDPQAVHVQYCSALDAWMGLERKMGLAYPAPLDEETRRVEDLKKVEDVSGLLQKLGDASPRYGWGGNLHVINFLFRSIIIEPISLSGAIADYSDDPANAARLQAMGKTVISLQDIDPAVLTISTGQSARFSKDWRPDRPVPQGNLSCQLEFIFENPLDAPISSILLAVGPGSVLEQKLLDAHSKLDALSARVEKCDNTIGDSYDLRALRETLTELKNRFGVT